MLSNLGSHEVFETQAISKYNNVILSEGMILASSKDDAIYLVSPDEGAEPGMKVR